MICRSHLQHQTQRLFGWSGAACAAVDAEAFIHAFDSNCSERTWHTKGVCVGTGAVDTHSGLGVPFQPLPERQHLYRDTIVPFGARSLWGFAKSKRSDALATQPAGSQPEPPVQQVEEPMLQTDSQWFPLPEQSVEAAAILQQALEAIERASFLAAKSDAIFTAAWAISALQAVQGYFGAPWWLTLFIFNFCARCITFPIFVINQKFMAKTTAINAELAKHKELEQRAKEADNLHEYQRLTAQAHREYLKVIDQKGDPAKLAIIPLGLMMVNAAVLGSVFMAVAALANNKVPSLASGGILWFQDLTSSDAYFGLPVLCALATLATVEYGLSATRDMVSADPIQQASNRLMKAGLRCLSFIFIPLGYYNSSAICMLWVANSCFGLIQAVVMRNGRARRFFGLPSVEELRAMNEKVAAANAAGRPAPQAAKASSSAQEPQLFTYDPTSAKPRAPPPGMAKALHTMPRGT